MLLSLKKNGLTSSFKEVIGVLKALGTPQKSLFSYLLSRFESESFCWGLEVLGVARITAHGRSKDFHRGHQALDNLEGSRLKRGYPAEGMGKTPSKSRKRVNSGCFQALSENFRVFSGSLSLSPFVGIPFGPFQNMVLSSDCSADC